MKITAWRKNNPDKAKESDYRSHRKPKNRYSLMLRWHKIHYPLEELRPEPILYEEYCKLISQKCHYCKGDLPAQGHGLDRRNNTLGYEKDNVVPCCAICNKARLNVLTVEEMELFVGPAIAAIRKSDDPFIIDTFKKLREYLGLAELTN